MKCEKCGSTQVFKQNTEAHCTHCGYTMKIHDDFILIFTYTLNSRDWDNKTGIPFDEEKTKELLLNDLREHLHVLADDGNFDLSNSVKFKSVEDARLEELYSVAVVNNYQTFKIDDNNFLDALSDDEKKEYKKLKGAAF